MGASCLSCHYRFCSLSISKAFDVAKRIVRVKMTMNIYHILAAAVLCFLALNVVDSAVHVKNTKSDESAGFGPPDVDGYTTVDEATCDDTDFLGTYSTLAQAQTACNNDTLCTIIMDNDCDNVQFVTCKGFNEPDHDDCVWVKDDASTLPSCSKMILAAIFASLSAFFR